MFELIDDIIQLKREGWTEEEIALEVWDRQLDLVRAVLLLQPIQISIEAVH